MDNLVIYIFVQRCEISVSKCFQQKTIVQKGAYFGLATQIRCSNRCIRSYCRSHSGTYSYSPRHSLRIDSKTTSSGIFFYSFLDCVHTLFRNESITAINYPELLTAFYYYIIYMHYLNGFMLKFLRIANILHVNT